MKKYSSHIIIAVVALALGYLLGSNLGTGDSSQTKGDINAVNTYNQLLLSPENMAFNKSLAGNEEAVSQTVSTLQIVVRRINEFNAISGVIGIMDAAPFASDFVKTAKDSQHALSQADAALQAALQLKAGEKVDMKKALKNAEAALACLDAQMAVGKKFVEAADEYLKDKDVKDNIMVATMRDLMVSHCAVNASLTQNDSEIDYWCNLDGKVKHEDMAFTIDQ